MMPRRLYLLLLLIGILFSGCLKDGVSKKQDELNRKYLYQFNQNLLSTIELLVTFNTAAQNMGESIEGSQQFSGFLMEMTVQCSSLIDLIRSAETLDPAEREGHIQLIMSNLRPQEITLPARIDKKRDQSNRLYLQSASDNLGRQLGLLLRDITREEQVIMTAGKVTADYFKLHSHHFLFSLLHDFVEPSELLSRFNREYLVELTRAIEMNIVAANAERKNQNSER
ncbi:MAG: hypothetical protein JXB60_03140 [Candidatus Cloacimonetes bacterium]|nr:hypothetical protein [Candidatus Cloacimonadota bacterium]